MYVVIFAFTIFIGFLAAGLKALQPPAFEEKLTCSCGSIIRGHLPALVTRIPFSTDTLSRGNPFVFQHLTV